MQVNRPSSGQGLRLDPQTMMALQYILQQRQSQQQQAQQQQTPVKDPIKRLGEKALELGDYESLDDFIAQQTGYSSPAELVNNLGGGGLGDWVNRTVSDLGFSETGANWGGQLGGGQSIGGTPYTGTSNLDSIFGAGNNIATPSAPVAPVTPTTPVSPAATGFMSNVGGMSGSLGGAGALGGILGGVALGAKGAKDLLNGKDTKGWEGWGGRATLGIATGGLSEVARLAGMGRKSTKDYQRERRDKVIEDGNTGWADTFQRAYNVPEGATPEGILRGTEGKLKDRWLKEDGTWDAREYAGVLGNAQTFGDDWFTLDDNTRNQVVQQAFNEDLYNHNKGDVLVSGDKRKERFREIFKQYQSGNNSLIPTGAVKKPLIQQNFNQWNPNAEVTSGSAFDPNSKQYNNLSKSQKDAYWNLRNSGR